MATSPAIENATSIRRSHTLFPKLPPSFPTGVNTGRLREFDVNPPLEYRPTHHHPANHSYDQNKSNEWDTDGDRSEGRMISEGIDQLGHSFPIGDLFQDLSYRS